ncbi:MAG: hypothetical protein V9E88_07440 [Ferruginibacter sp.]
MATGFGAGLAAGFALATGFLAAGFTAAFGAGLAAFFAGAAFFATGLAGAGFLAAGLATGFLVAILFTFLERLRLKKHHLLL